jgi:hypothetical protein
LIETANMHLPGRQVDPTQVSRDLWRLSRWERARLRDAAGHGATPVDRSGTAPIDSDA